MRRKSKFISFILSFIPGLSHFYIGYAERGLIYLLIVGIVCGGSILMGFITYSSIFLIPLLGGYAIIWLIALIDSLNLIGKIKHRAQFGDMEDSLREVGEEEMNKKIISLGLSLIPGAGHMYLGYQTTGLVYMALFFFSMFFMGWLNLSFLLFLIPLIWFYAFFDAFHIVNGNEVRDREVDILNLLPKINHEYIGKGLILLGLLIIFQRIFFPMISDYLSYQIRNYIQTSIVSLIFIIIGIQMLRKKKKLDEDREGEDEEYEN